MEIKFYTQENDKSALECGKIIINNIRKQILGGK